MQRKLPGLAGCAGKNPQADQGKRRAAQDRAPRGQRLGRLPDVGYVQRIQSLRGKLGTVVEQVDDGQQKAHVANSGDDESLLGRSGRRGPVVPESDQQVGRKPHQFPEGVELDDVGRQHQPQHGSGEQGHVGEVARHAGISPHVAQGVNLDQQANAGDHHQHDAGNRVQQQTYLNGGITEVQPGVRRKGQVRSLVAPDQQQE